MTPEHREGLINILKAKPRPFCIAVCMTMWKGNLQFNIEADPRTKTREGLATYMVDNFETPDILAAVKFIEGQTPAPVASVSTVSEPVSENAGLGDALVKAMNDALAKAVDRKSLQKMVEEEVKKLPPLRVDFTVNGEPLKTFDGYTRPELLEALDLAVHRMNILMVGPAGCGKTHIARQVSEAMDLRFASISCSAGMSESHLTGWLIPTGEGGRFEYVQSTFVDIYENGGVFLFDEIDAADSNTLLFVNQALANGSFFIPQRFGKPEVVKHKDCVIMAAANTFGTGGSMTYAGRERLDEATLDRFRAGVLPVGYDAKLEENLVDADVLDWGRILRDRIQASRLQRVMSTRFMIDATKLRRSGAPLEKIQTTFFHGWSDDERRKVA